METNHIDINLRPDSKDISQALLLGLAIGDALGVPVEFKKRSSFHVDSMTGYGSHNQPPGTWSDDTSLALALADNINDGKVNLNDVAQSFIAWRKAGKYTPHGEVFDIGGATSTAIRRLAQGIQPEKAGGVDEWDNGNGSLMRIAPLLFCLLDKTLEERFALAASVSSITHGHPVSKFACFLFLEMLLMLYNGHSKEEAYAALRKNRELYAQFILPQFVGRFSRLLESDISLLPEDEIKSGGYVIDTLEAAFWAFLNNDSYRDTVLAAVNLGEDTDTTGAVAGALAGLYYGLSEIPEDWIKCLTKSGEIREIAKKMLK